MKINIQFCYNACYNRRNTQNRILCIFILVLINTLYVSVFIFDWIILSRIQPQNELIHQLRLQCSSLHATIIDFYYHAMYNIDFVHIIDLRKCLSYEQYQYHVLNEWEKYWISLKQICWQNIESFENTSIFQDQIVKYVLKIYETLLYRNLVWMEVSFEHNVGTRRRRANDRKVYDFDGRRYCETTVSLRHASVSRSNSIFLRKVLPSILLSFERR